MTRWIGTAILGVVLMFGGPAMIDPAAARDGIAMQKPQAEDATDLSARRRVRHVLRYADRAVAPPRYYDRPDYYRPYPYALPAPFFLGFGFGPW